MKIDLERRRVDEAIQALKLMVAAFSRPMPPIDSKRYEALRQATGVLEAEPEPGQYGLLPPKGFYSEEL